MSDTEVRHETERELQRVVDRLTSMPLNRMDQARGDVQECASVLLAQGRLLGVAVPADVTVPDLAPSGWGAMIAVLGQDCLAAAPADADLTALHAALVALRRSLP